MPTNIEWAEESWNPVVGCNKISAGCKNCYAARYAQRLSYMDKTRKKYQEVITYMGEWTGRIAYFPERLEQPLHWRKPRRIFVCSMGFGSTMFDFAFLNGDEILSVGIFWIHFEITKY